MESALAIKDTEASRVMNATLNTTNHLEMKASYFVHIVIMLVTLVDVIQPVRKVVACANVVGQCSQTLVDVLTSMNAQLVKILVRIASFV